MYWCMLFWCTKICNTQYIPDVKADFNILKIWIEEAERERETAKHGFEYWKKLSLHKTLVVLRNNADAKKGFLILQWIQSTHV